MYAQTMENLIFSRFVGHRALFMYNSKALSSVMQVNIYVRICNIITNVRKDLAI